VKALWGMPADNVITNGSSTLSRESSSARLIVSPISRVERAQGIADPSPTIGVTFRVKPRRNFDPEQAANRQALGHHTIKYPVAISHAEPLNSRLPAAGLEPSQPIHPGAFQPIPVLFEWVLSRFLA